MTVIEPRTHSVGSGPSEKMHRSIIDATSVRMPDSRGNVITIASDDNMMAQISHDICELSSINQSKLKLYSQMTWEYIPGTLFSNG